jgi:hypothetical protein
LDIPPATGFIASAEAWGGLSYIPNTRAGDGKVVAAGWYITNSGANGFIAVYDSLNTATGNRKNAVVVASPGTRADWVLDNAVDKDGNIYAVGFTTGNLGSAPLGEGDAYIVKYAPDLTNPKFVNIGTAKADMFRKLDIDKNKGILYALGYTYGNYQGNNADNTQGSGDILVQKFDLNLNKLEARQFGTPYEDRALCALKDSVLYVGGMTEGSLVSANQGSFDGFVVALKTSDLSIVKPTSTASDDIESPKFGAKIYPNPVHTTLNIETKSFTDLNYIVYNSVGQAQLQGKITSSIQQLEVSSLQSGIYFIRFMDVRNSVVQRFVKQ